MGLYPLHRAFGLRRYFAATYQSVSGIGRRGGARARRADARVGQGRAAAAQGLSAPDRLQRHPPGRHLRRQRLHRRGDQDGGGEPQDPGLPELKVSATCVRVPVVRAHSVAINAEFEQPVDLAAARAADRRVSRGRAARRSRPEQLSDAAGLQRAGRSAAWAGCASTPRFDNGLAFWVSGDNLWKGAALNSIQIAELMIREGLLKPKAALAAVEARRRRASPGRIRRAAPPTARCP